MGSYSLMSFFLLRTIFLLLSTSSFCNTFASLTQYACHPDQRDALLEFKNEFKIRKLSEFLDLDDQLMDATSYPKTKSWGNSSDCCFWDGVTCDAKSGEVIGLDLSCSCLHGNFKPNSSLFRLRHLQNLNLAYNNFNNSPIPTGLHNLRRLERLNLSHSSFLGQIPTEILHLTKLVSLDLSYFPHSANSSLFIENPLFLRLLAKNLRSLRKLDMSSVNIASELPHEFTTMWSLRSLILNGCNLFGEFPSDVFLIPNLHSISLNHNPNLKGNLPVFHGNNSMQILSLSETSFSGIIPESIRNLKHLTSLTLTSSNFSGKIPSSLGNLSYLSWLDLSLNNFFGEIPSLISNVKELTFFSVQGNKLSGNFPLALLNLTKLRVIIHSFNQFTGSLPSNISQLSKLESFLVSSNSFTGAIPSSLFMIPSLANIYLDDNQLSDINGIQNISSLSNLLYLYFDKNNFKVSPVDLNFFLPLKQLVALDLSGIPLSTANTTSISDFPSQLEALYLSGCNITEFPEFIRNYPNLSILDLSHNKIKGQVPEWLWKLPDLSSVSLSSNYLNGFKGSSRAIPGSKIIIFDLRSNAFQGPLFIPSRFIQYFWGSNNNFSGEIPRSICGLTSPTIIDLSNNSFHGSIPQCLGTYMSSLSDLNLRNNYLNGTLPEIFMNAKELRTLDVSHNQLEGKLPTSLTGCSALEVLNVGNNRIDDAFPFWLHSLQKLQVLVLRSNKFHGMLHHTNEIWFGFPRLQIFDVSHNNFLGDLPSDYFMNWTAISSKKDTNTGPTYIGNPRDYGYYTSLVLMSKGVSMEMERILTIYTAIDFSGNQLHGQIPNSIGQLKELRILNFSSNAFTGHIPSSLANLTNLESLDLSQNKIFGEIPPELGTLSSLGWINVSHNELVGSIPQGTQFQRQNCSSYEGNPGLYGPSLKDVCGDIYALTPPQPESLETNEDEDEEWFSWIAAGLGFPPGVVFGLTIGFIVGFIQARAVH